jgi:hypothetical protein
MVKNAFAALTGLIICLRFFGNSATKATQFDKYAIKL